MGYRLHSATKYEVKYSTGDFNYQCEEIHNLLSACGAEYTGDCDDSEFEVSRDDWEKVIEKLKNLDSLPEEEKDEIIQNAQNQAEHIKRKAQEEIERDKRNAQKEMREAISDVAIEAAKKLVEKEMDEKIQKQFVQDFIDQAGDKEW